ncbi:MAG TPA: DsrE family protein [Cyclobacteriaceae bacterium]|nr:DsrE family protein [Cyclobacteriaceae bacterium]
MNKIIIVLVLAGFTASAQIPQRVNPVIKDFGGIFEIPYAAEKPDPSMNYNIVIEVEQMSEKPDTLNWALNNVARMLNLHTVGGLPKEKMHVVLAIHGGATYTVMNNDGYKAKYKMDNPNLKIYQQLQAAGVKMFVCGQSLIARDVDPNKMVPEVKVSVSMLTILTTYQLKGYAVLKF